MSIDPVEAKKLAAEFKANPKGPHSPALQRLLNAMRGLPVRGKHVLIFDKPSGRYILGELTGERGMPLTKHAGLHFAEAADGEWHVFRHRLRALFGIDPDN